MKLTKNDIYKICIKRLAQIFGLDVSQIDLDMNWDCKLFNVKRSFWEINPFEELNDDIEDAANELIFRKIKNNQLKIRTVRDLCEYMVDRYEDDPDLFEKNMFPPFDKAWLEDRK